MGDSIKVRFIQDTHRYAIGVVSQCSIWAIEHDRLARQNIHLTIATTPPQSTIQKHLLDPLSLVVLEGGFKDGDHITAEMKGGKVGLVKE